MSLTPVQQQAYDAINSRMEPGFLNPVGNDDVRAAIAELDGLSRADADAVIDEMARTGRLDRFTSELTDQSPLGFGGVGLGEAQDFFNRLAPKLDGASLATVAQSLSRAGSDVSNYDYVQAFGTAVGNNARRADAVEFVRQMAPFTTDRSSSFSTYIGGSTTMSGDKDAMAVAEVLGRLRGANAEAAFAALSTEQLQAVLGASLEGAMFTSVSPAGGTVSMSYDANEFRDIMRAGASTSDPELKARLFDAAGDQLRAIGQGSPFVPTLSRESEGWMLDGMTELIRSDTTGVVRELAYNRATYDGSDLATYAKAMLNNGRTEALGEIMAELSTGNGNNQNPVDRFEAATTLPNGRDRYDNAGTLGYFTGAVYRGITAIASDTESQNALATAVAKTALTVIDKSKPWGAAVGYAASVAKEWVQFGIAALNGPPGASPAQQLELGAIPFDPNTDERAVSSAAYAEFNARISDVQRLARP